MKFGMATGAGISFFILDWVGFGREARGSQTAQALFMIRFLLAGLCLAWVAPLRHPLTQARMADIRRQLENRRGIV